MKTIIEINGLNYASTGRIMLNIAKTAKKEGFDVFTFCRNSRESKKHLDDGQYLIGFWIDRIVSERLSYILGLNGYFNIINTFVFLNRIKKMKPDLIHLHALCDNYLNINMLFKYIKKNKIPVVWTFHDPWQFTGRCAQSICNKWQTGCGNCPYLNIYPKSLFLDNSKFVWKKRKKLYSNIDNLTIVTPSKWLQNQTTLSFFSYNYPIKIINNGIDLNVFKPSYSNVRIKYKLQNKFIIIGVSYGWSIEKGLDTFIYLAKHLPADFQIILVGGNDKTDNLLPDNIISIHKTHNQQELAELYTIADLFVNPTIDENFPTVNIEALACGTPVLTYATGGSAEIIDETCGDSVLTKDREMLIKKILFIYENKPYDRSDCLNRAKHFDMNDKFVEYVDLYKKILN